MKFSLRTVLVAVAVLAAVFAVCAGRYQRVSNVVNAVAKCGGFTFFDGTLQNSTGLEYLLGVSEVDLSDSSITINDTAIHNIAKNPRKFTLRLDFTDVTTSQLALLRGARITELHLDGLDIDDDAVDAIGQIKSLEVLYACDTRISEEGFQRLEILLPQCEILKTREEVCHRGLNASTH